MALNVFNGISLPMYIREFYLIVFFTLVRNIATIGDQQSGTHQIAKRMDLELCLDQFDVHRDTIIRTEESLSIGGKYLQGLNIETLKQCQHLCCETDNCDVFIFEGKNGGYCYLFECGPPENFRCKFTRHANYTSAVLTPSHRTATTTTTTQSPSTTPLPQPQIHPQLNSQQTTSPSQHELELTNLKQKPSDIRVAYSNTHLTKGTPAPTASGAQLQIAANSAVSSQSNPACHRFQFQCHSGECIAVYNACDGIPQCEDGSDEGPECPANAMTLGKTSLSSGKVEEMPSLVMKQSNKQQIGDSISQQVDIQGGAKLYQPSPNIGNREDPMSAPSVWANRKMQDTQDLEHSSKIFNHKGGIQIAGRTIPQSYQNPIPNLYNAIQRDMYMQQQDYQLPYRNPIVRPQDHMIDPQSLNWQQQQMIQQPILTGEASYISAVNGQPVPQVRVPMIKEQALLTPTPLNPQQIPAAPVKPEAGKSANPKENTKHKEGPGGDGNNSNESEEYDEYEEKSTQPPKKKQHKHKTSANKGEKSKTKSNKYKTEKPVDAPLHEQLKLIKDSMEIEFIDHDGQSERPGGAVLSLTLGLIVTAALAILVGCRMRTVTRRTRRSGKTPYAHDADFLVNGMYL